MYKLIQSNLYRLHISFIEKQENMLKILQTTASYLQQFMDRVNALDYNG